MAIPPEEIEDWPTGCDEPGSSQPQYRYKMNGVTYV
jgi:hypothetical protein